MVSKYRQGYMFERKVMKIIPEIIRDINRNWKVYVISSRGSHGLADILVHIADSRLITCFALQCKKRKPSIPQMKRMIKYALQEYGMLLFFVYYENGELTFYPSLHAYLSSLTGGE